MSAEVEGLPELRQTLKYVPDVYREEVVRLFAKAAGGIEADARRNAPYDDGDLRRSIGTVTSAQGLHVEVGSRGVKYAAHVEFGTSKMPAKKFLFPAFRKHVRVLRKDLREMLKDSGFRLRSRMRRHKKTR
jgi:HK97 gp10 family phage protein